MTELDIEWQDKAKGILKAELKRRNLTYADLSKKLEAKGHKDEERNLRNKVARGSFTAAFFLQCLDAIGCKRVDISDY